MCIKSQILLFLCLVSKFPCKNHVKYRKSKKNLFESLNMPSFASANFEWGVRKSVPVCVTPINVSKPTKLDMKTNETPKYGTNSYFVLVPMMLNRSLTYFINCGGFRSLKGRERVVSQRYLQIRDNKETQHNNRILDGDLRLCGSQIE